MKVAFVKMHGAGNDFVMVDDRAGIFPTEDPAFIARLANRPDGIGCEGVILVQNAPAAPSCSQGVPALATFSSAPVVPSCSQGVPALAISSSNPAVPSCSQGVPALASKPDFAMRFFNPDGTEADMCGNGARCVAAFARAIGAAPSARMCFATRAGLVSAEVLGEGRVTICLPDPKDLRANFVNSGVPHAIVPVEDLAAADVDGEGRRIRYSAAYAPAGTNVDFVRWAGPSSLSIRTYERGVEAESFACGTGAVAAAVVGVAQYGLDFPVSVTTARGDTLVIDGQHDGDAFRHVSLTGSVATVFNGEIEVRRE